MKRIETMIELFAHLITRNSDRPFNEIWDYYFRSYDIGNMSYVEVVKWLNEKVVEE